MEKNLLQKNYVDHEVNGNTITGRWPADNALMEQRTLGQMTTFPVGNKNYNNREAKEASWSSIALNLEVSKKDALDKWKSLRNTYRIVPNFEESKQQSDECSGNDKLSEEYASAEEEDQEPQLVQEPLQSSSQQDDQEHSDVPEQKQLEPYSTLIDHHQLHLADLNVAHL
ncbi:hypothetical protein ACLKA6_010212 [Drosophila palustris]